MSKDEANICFFITCFRSSVENTKERKFQTNAKRPITLPEMAQLRFVCIIKVHRTFSIILRLTKLSTTPTALRSSFLPSRRGVPHMLSELNCLCHSTCVFSSHLTSSYQRLYHHHHPAIHGSCT